MENHSKEIINHVNAIRTTVKLLGHDIIAEHHKDNTKIFIAFNKNQQHWFLAYSDKKLRVYFEYKTIEINDAEGLLTQILLLQQIMEKL